MKHHMILILCIIAVLAVVFCLAAFAAEDGMTFTAYDAYEMSEAFTAPRTYEAWVKIPTDWNSRGVIAGNWHDYGYGLDFEVQSDGTPRVVYCRKPFGGSKSIKSIAFENVDLRTDTWTFLAITESSDHVDCYINGVLVQTVNTTVTKRVCTFPLTINGDNFCLGNPYWFRGALRSIAFYKDYRTAEEIAADMTAPDTGDANLIAAYTFNGTPTATIPDLAGNYPLTKTDYWHDSVELPAYSYAMAAIGDLQFLNYFIPEEYATVFEYLRDETDKQNIVYAIGLGDVTQSKNNPAEFAVAAAGYSILDGKLLYSVARGNHDNTGPFNSYFGTPAYQSTLSGTLDGDIANSYRTFHAGKTDYLAITLDYGPSDAALAWARGLIEAHPSHKVIINTHSYMWRGHYLQDTSCAPAPTNYGYENDGVDIWNELTSQYENIVLVLSGHFAQSISGVEYTKMTGIHGNVVTSILHDPEAMEHYSPEDPIGLVEMLYFSEDGDEVTAVCYSPIRRQYYGEPLTFPLGETDDSTIGTAEDFVAVMNDSSRWGDTIVLRGNIDLTGYTQHPIGNTTTPFTGAIVGNGFTISGIDISEDSYAGLIGYMTSGSVRDLTVSGSVSATGNYCGGIVGYAGTGACTIENCRNLCTVTSGGEYVGGIVGYFKGTDSSTSGTPLSVIRNCQNDGIICSTKSGQTDVGGIVGIIWSVGGVSDCYNTGLVTSSVSAAKAYTGGICGRTYSYGKITNCFNATAPTAPNFSSSYCRAIVGYPAAKNSSNNFYTDGLGMSDANCGSAYTPAKFATLNANDYWTGTTAPVLASFHTHVWDAGAETKAPGCTTEGEYTYTCITCGAENTVTEDILGHTTSSGVCARCGKYVGTLHIASAADFIAFANDQTKWTATILLDRDIDLTGYAQTPVGNATTPFAGVFDGGGHTISGVRLFGETYVGLFGKLSGGTVKNLTADGVVNATGNIVGGIVAYAGTDPCTIENCHNLCTVTGARYVGGICGYLRGSDSSTSNDPRSILRNCQNSGTVCSIAEGQTDVGGIAGIVYSVGGVSDCYNRGKVIALYSTTATAYTGGICGRTYTYGKIQNCYSDGEVLAPASATSYCRSLVGYPGTKNYANNFYAEGRATDAVYGNVYASENFAALNVNGKWTSTAEGPQLTAFITAEKEVPPTLVLAIGEHKIALVSTVDDLHYKSVGFALTIDGSTQIFTTETVYTEIPYYAESFTPAYFGQSGYVFAIVVDGIPNYETLTFAVVKED